MANTMTSRQANGQYQSIEGPLERFLAKIQITPTGCWQWMAQRIMGNLA